MCNKINHKRKAEARFFKNLNDKSLDLIKSIAVLLGLYIAGLKFSDVDCIRNSKPCKKVIFGYLYLP